MKQLLIKLYEWLTEPIYRRLARDLTLQLQSISRAYIDQHEMLTAKIVEELVRLNIRLDQQEAAIQTRHFELADIEPGGQPEDGAPGKMSEEEVWELLKDASSSVDVVAFCAKNNVPIQLYFDLDSKYHGIDPKPLRKLRMLEETNLELRRLLTELMRDQRLEAPKAKVENGNGRQ